jgi:non-heme chloroperoxidase
MKSVDSLKTDELVRRRFAPLKKISVTVLVMHSEDDQIVPYQAAGPLSAKLLKNGTLKTYKDYPHGMPTTQADVINADLLAFIKG